MATLAVPEFDNEIVLHLDVAPNETADAEIVGQALAAWVAVAQAAAEALDPMVELRVGLLAVEPGSVRLHAIFEFFETKIIARQQTF